METGHEPDVIGEKIRAAVEPEAHEVELLVSRLLAVSTPSPWLQPRAILACSIVTMLIGAGIVGTLLKRPASNGAVSTSTKIEPVIAATKAPEARIVIGNAELRPVEPAIVVTTAPDGQVFMGNTGLRPGSDRGVSGIVVVEGVNR